MLAGGALAMTLLERGQLDAAQQVIRERGLEGVLPDIPPMTSVILARMQVRATGGDHDGALEDWELALARQRGRGPLGAGWLDDQARAAELLRDIGRPADATALAAEALDVARHWNTPGAVGQMLRASARVGAGQDSVPLLEEAVAHLERSPARAELARALADLGGALRRRGDRVRSREPLRAAVALAHECGADGLAHAARQELAASGIRLRRMTVSGADSLTASERRITYMAAEGKSNAEIAQALFVTIKTVEMHLTHAYRKLGIKGRAGLPASQPETQDDPLPAATGARGPLAVHERSLPAHPVPRRRFNRYSPSIHRILGGGNRFDSLVWPARTRFFGRASPEIPHKHHRSSGRFPHMRGAAPDRVPP